MTLICHIAGPSGSGKTTLLKKIKELYPAVITKDLDEFDDEIVRNPISKKEWTAEDFLKNKQDQQQLINDFLEVHNEDFVVFAGFHTEDNHVLHIPTDNKFLLDTDVNESMRRMHARNMEINREYKRNVESDILQAKKDVEYLLSIGYVKMSEEEILNFIHNSLTPMI
ncbi:MAG: AAA family ATPase [Patescibacteria group bacterium]